MEHRVVPNYANQGEELDDLIQGGETTQEMPDLPYLRPHDEWRRAVYRQRLLELTAYIVNLTDIGQDVPPEVMEVFNLITRKSAEAHRETGEKND